MPMPVSAHADRRPSPRRRPSRRASQHDLAALGELAGVAQQIEHDLPQPRQVGAHRADSLGAVDARAGCRSWPPAARRSSPRRAISAGELDVLEVQLHLARLDLGEIEDLVDQVQEVLAGAVDASERLDQVVPALVLGVLPAASR